MNHIYKAIASEFLSDDSEFFLLFETRIQSLYGYALEKGFEQYPLEFGQLCNQIVQFEGTLMIQTDTSLNNFNQVKPSDIIEQYSLISFELAKNRYKTGKPILLGALLREALNELFNENGIVSNEDKEKYKNTISETFLDFIYASGKSDNTSLRMIPIIKSEPSESLEENNDVFSKSEVHQDNENVVALEEKLAEALKSLTALQEAFDDKIAEDQHKNKLFDNMHRELISYQNGVLDKVINTMALDIIQLVDFTKRYHKVYEKKEPTEENYKKLLRIVKGLVEDLDDVLYRQNVEPYSVSGNDVDLKRQKIIETIETDDETKDNQIATRSVVGYEKDGKVLRPERIKIYKYNPNKVKKEK